MVAVEKATNLFGEPIEAHPRFTHAAFLSSDFAPSTYISSLRSFVSLETLTSELKSHLTALNSDLIDLVNREYADFVGLGTRLAGAGEAAARVQDPLAELRGKVGLCTKWLVLWQRSEIPWRRDEWLCSISCLGLCTK